MLFIIFYVHGQGVTLIYMHRQCFGFESIVKIIINACMITYVLFFPHFITKLNQFVFIYDLLLEIINQAFVSSEVFLLINNIGFSKSL